VEIKKNETKTNFRSCFALLCVFFGPFSDFDLKKALFFFFFTCFYYDGGGDGGDLELKVLAFVILKRHIEIV
jgi:hypothetical protein